MNDEWPDDDDPKLRALFQFLLRSHVRHQDGRHSLAPTLMFADADYEEGDGRCGLHTDAKQANEPAIVYVRADALVYAIDHAQAEKEAAVAAERGVGMVTPLPPECAPKGIPVLVAGGIAMKKTGGQWYSGMAEPAFERPIEWDVKWWSPIPQQNVTPARANTDALAAYNARVRAEALMEAAEAVAAMAEAEG